MSSNFLPGILAALLVFGPSLQLMAQLTGGPYRVGFSKIVYPTERQSNGERIDLLLNIWYPTGEQGETIRLADFTWLHNSLSDPADSAKVAAISSLEMTLRRWFGPFGEERWHSLIKAPSNSLLNAAPMTQRFPLIVGRLRIFSTTLTAEELASHGFIVCMLTKVDDFPPDNHEAYLRQVSDEIGFFVGIKHFLSEKGLCNERCGLLGFSGNGISPFIAAMHTSEFNSTVLLESGVFLRDIHDIIKLHPLFSRDKFQSELLFLYNKQRFEKEQMALHFAELPTQKKQLVLIDNESQHHWDFATEGTIASHYLENRPEAIRSRQLADFRHINELVVAFFRKTLQDDNK